MTVALALPPSRARAAVAPNATLAGREQITATMAAFVVALDRPLASFAPGQYVPLGVFTETGELVQRPYSIVSLDASRSRLELLVRRLPDGQLSNLLWRTAVGARIRVGPAKGLFTLDRSDRRPRILVGTGTGVAPLLAMLEAATAERGWTSHVLIHGASFHAELAFGERLARWAADGLALDYRPSVSRPAELRNRGWTGRTGRAETQLDRLLDESPHLAYGGSAAYLCGNPDMIEAATLVLARWGFSSPDIRSERFHVPAAKREV